MSFQNLFLAKLPRNLTDADLYQIFAYYNPIGAKVMLEVATGKSKGFGFVLFKSEVVGHEAYEAMNHRHVMVHDHKFNLVIYPSQHTGKSAASACPALYIRNIPVTVPQHQVKQFLSSFGKLVYCSMRVDRHGNPIWVVYAEYDSVESAKNALEKLHGSNCYFRSNVCIMAKYADNDESRQERRRRREDGQSWPPTRAASYCMPIADTCVQPPKPSDTMTNPSNEPLELQAWHNPGNYKKRLPSNVPVSFNSSINSNSIGTETTWDESVRKVPVHAYRHNPYSMECLVKKK